MDGSTARQGQPGQRHRVEAKLRLLRARPPGAPRALRQSTWSLR